MRRYRSTKRAVAAGFSSFPPPQRSCRCTPQGAAPGGRGGRYPRGGVAATAIVAFLIVAAAGIWYWRSNASISRIDSIAVIPFAGVGGTADTDYLSDGITESLIGRVVQHGDMIQVSAELTNARDNTEIRGERYERPASEVIVMEQKIAGDIADRLRSKPSGAEKRALQESHRG